MKTGDALRGGRRKHTTPEMPPSQEKTNPEQDPKRPTQHRNQNTRERA